MDTKKKLSVSYAVIGVLAVALIVSLFFNFHEPATLGSVLENGKQDITAQRDKIREDCSSTDAAVRKQCGDDLQELADILREFSKDLDKATTTPSR
jgi:hypothetical protein